MYLEATTTQPWTNCSSSLWPLMIIGLLGPQFLENRMKCLAFSPGKIHRYTKFCVVNGLMVTAN